MPCSALPGPVRSHRRDGVLRLSTSEASTGETVVLSAAAVPSGRVVGQIARSSRAVVGIAGGPRSRWIVDNWASTPRSTKARAGPAQAARAVEAGHRRGIRERRRRHPRCLIANLNLRVRISVRPDLAYNDALPPPGRAFSGPVVEAGRMEGFIITDYAARFRRPWPSSPSGTSRTFEAASRSSTASKQAPAR